jgi:hypothetical protein
MDASGRRKDGQTRAKLIEAVGQSIGGRTGSWRTIASDRLPSYSESTIDIEVPHNFLDREVASCSIRTDYSENTRVVEIAIGLDRLVEIINV